MSIERSHLSSAQFENFLIVAKKQSITAAANCLGISKAAVSQSIKTLELELGVPLLNRTTRKVTLTHEGELLAEQCERVKHELDVARQMVSAMHKKPSGKLKISCSPRFVEAYLMPRLKIYREKFPDVQLEVNLTERVIDLKRDQVDFALGMSCATVSDDTVARSICQTNYALCASPAYLEKHGVPTSLHDLKDHIYIGHHGRREYNMLETNDQTIEVNTAIVGDHIAFVKMCVLEGLGISKFRRTTIHKELEHGKLIELMPEEFDRCFDLNIYYQKNQFVQPKVKELVKLFIDMPTTKSKKQNDCTC